MNKQEAIEAIQKEIKAKLFAYTGDYNCFMLPIYLENRDNFIEYCAENGVEAGKHFSKSIQWAKEFGYETGTCPNAERIAEKVLVIPVHYNMKDSDLQKLIKGLKTLNRSTN